MSVYNSQPNLLSFGMGSTIELALSSTDSTLTPQPSPGTYSSHHPEPITIPLGYTDAGRDQEQPPGALQELASFLSSSPKQPAKDDQGLLMINYNNVIDHLLEGAKTVIEIDDLIQPTTKSLDLIRTLRSAKHS